MPAPGSNMQFKDRGKILTLLLDALGFCGNGLLHSSYSTADDGTLIPRKISLMLKIAAPATNTAADAPTGKGDLCVVHDGTKGFVPLLYRCTAYTSTTVFTWTQITIT